MNTLEVMENKLHMRLQCDKIMEQEKGKALADKSKDERPTPRSTEKTIHLKLDEQISGMLNFLNLESEEKRRSTSLCEVTNQQLDSAEMEYTLPKNSKLNYPPLPDMLLKDTDSDHFNLSKDLETNNLFGDM